MGLFDLPRGELELNLKPKKGDSKRKGWTSVEFTDCLYKEDIADCVERWSKDYKVTGARYNGKPVEIPKIYHWELRFKGETVGVFKTRAEAYDEWMDRRWRRRTDDTVKVGTICFVEE